MDYFHNVMTHYAGSDNRLASLSIFTVHNVVASFHYLTPRVDMEDLFGVGIVGWLGFASEHAGTISENMLPLLRRVVRANIVDYLRKNIGCKRIDQHKHSSFEQRTREGTSRRGGSRTQFRVRRPVISLESVDELADYHTYSQPLAVICEEERRKVLEESLHRLQPYESEVMRLYYFENEAETKIAERFSVTPNSISRTIQHARKKLEFYLRRYVSP